MTDSVYHYNRQAESPRHFIEAGAPRAARALSLVDPITRKKLRDVLHELTDLTGFAVAGFNRVRDDGYIQLVETVGTSLSDADLERTALPLELWHRAVGQTAHWGGWLYTAAADCPDEIRDFLLIAEGEPPATDPELWDPYCGLDFPIHDDNGALVGSLGIDLPRDGKVPPPERHHQLNAVGRLAARSVLAIVERDLALQRARIVQATHNASVRASRAASVPELVADAIEGITNGIDADQVTAGWFHPAVLDLRMPSDPALADQRLAVVNVWHRDTVLRVVESGGGHQHGASPETLLLPIGDDTACYGALVVRRSSTRASWTRAELEGARAIAVELAHAISAYLVRNRLHDQLDALRGEIDHHVQVAASVAHDLASPLHAMANYLDLLEERSLADPALRARLLSALRAGTTQVTDVAEQLQVLHGERHDQEGHTLDLAPLFDEVLHLHQPQAEQGRQLLEARIETDHTLTHGNRSDLRRVLVNITSNALKYTPAEGRIELSLREDGDQLVLECRDTGIGIAERQLPHVFEEFYRAPDPWARSRPGTGLGLPIVKRLVEDLGGSVRLTSALGVGTSVEVRLPRVA
ncbi:HAMP domain-containing sensor histidine kinase [Nocardioides dubius]|uniref:histidine kinase n=1 Tax=Nocardioides dubius TaxID=317019 RepID=A0ABN1U1S3_9ACTN